MLTRRTGIAQSTLGKLETSQTTGVDFATLEKIAKALECPASYLIVESKT